MRDFLASIKNIPSTIKNIVMNIQWLDISVSTYVRWILAIILSINTILTYFEINPIAISESTIYEIVTVVLNIAILIVNTYKNNSTSREAIISDKIMKALKAAALSDEVTAIGKLEDILAELNGENFVSADHTNSDNDVDEDISE